MGQGRTRAETKGQKDRNRDKWTLTGPGIGETYFSTVYLIDRLLHLFDHLILLCQSVPASVIKIF